MTLTLKKDNFLYMVKKIIFTPSQRTTCIIIGKDNEYWIDLQLGFCSCKDFYFNTLSGGSECYHLKNARKAIDNNLFETIMFDDCEYLRFLQAIVEDNLKLLSCS
jgi:predicted nucleic acid-binding Zn finger protein